MWSGLFRFWRGAHHATSPKPPWPNGQAVGLQIRSLGPRVPQEVFRATFRQWKSARGGPSRAEHSGSPPCSPLGSPQRRYQKLPADFSLVATLPPRRFSSSPPPSLASSLAARIADPLRPDDRHRRRAFDIIASTAVAAAAYVPLTPPSPPPALPPPPFPLLPPPPPLPPPLCPRPPLLPPPSPPPCPCSLPPPSAFSLIAATATVRVVPFGQPSSGCQWAAGCRPRAASGTKG